MKSGGLAETCPVRAYAPRPKYPGRRFACPGLIAGCPYRALPTGPQYRRLPLKAPLRLPWANRRLPLQGVAYVTPIPQVAVKGNTF